MFLMEVGGIGKDITGYSLLEIHSHKPEIQHMPVLHAEDASS